MKPAGRYFCQQDGRLWLLRKTSPSQRVVEPSKADNLKSKVKTEDNKIFHFEYNGTVDVCLPFLYDTADELEANWRRRDWKNCTCGNKENHKPVEIVSTYGYGFYWPGIICIKCKVIVDGHQVDYDNEKRGFPDWFIADMSEESKKFYGVK